MVTAHATRGSHEDDSGLAFRVLGYPCGCQALRLTQAAEFESPAGILSGGEDWDRQPMAVARGRKWGFRWEGSGRIGSNWRQWVPFGGPAGKKGRGSPRKK